MQPDPRKLGHGERIAKIGVVSALFVAKNRDYNEQIMSDAPEGWLATPNELTSGAQSRRLVDGRFQRGKPGFTAHMTVATPPDCRAPYDPPVHFTLLPNETEIFKRAHDGAQTRSVGG